MTIAEIEAEIKQIDALRLGPHLPNRDYGLHLRKMFLERELAKINISGRLRVTEGRDTAFFTKPP